MSGRGSPVEYRLRVCRYEVACEIMMRIFAVIGRWGDDDAHALASELISDLAYLKLEGGLNWWLDLRFYPAVLLHYAYGSGVLKASRYERLFSWFCPLVQRDQREPSPFMQQLGYWGQSTHDQDARRIGAEQKPFQ
jgi:hypothetical protein